MTADSSATGMCSLNPVNKLLITLLVVLLGMGLIMQLFEGQSASDFPRLPIIFMAALPGFEGLTKGSRTLKSRALLLSPLFAIVVLEILVINIWPSRGGHLMFWMGTCWVFLGLAYAWRIGESKTLESR